jgi:hypothetical protein
LASQAAWVSALACCKLFVVMACSDRLSDDKWLYSNARCQLIELRLIIIVVQNTLWRTNLLVSFTPSWTSTNQYTTTCRVGSFSKKRHCCD